MKIDRKFKKEIDGIIREMYENFDKVDIDKKYLGSSFIRARTTIIYKDIKFEKPDRNEAWKFEDVKVGWWNNLSLNGIVRRYRYLKEKRQAKREKEQKEIAIKEANEKLSKLVDKLEANRDKEPKQNGELSIEN